MSTFLKDKFILYLQKTSDEVSAEILECSEDDIAQWKQGGEEPTLTVVSAWVERIMLQSIQSHYDKIVAQRVEKAMKAFNVEGDSLINPTAATQAVRELNKRTPKPLPIGATQQTQQDPTGKRDLAVLFPCHKTTNPATTRTLVNVAMRMGMSMRYNDGIGDAMVYHARGKLATWFVHETDSTWSLWLDDDMVAPIGMGVWFKWIANLPPSYPDTAANQHFLDRLMSHKKSIVGAAYTARQAVGNYMFNEATDPAIDRLARTFPNQLLETKWVGTGCILVHRQVYLDIEKAFPELAPNGSRKHWEYFMPTNEWPGEDVAFCMRAKIAGHTTFVDLGLQPLHFGFCGYGGHNTTMKKLQ